MATLFERARDGDDSAAAELDRLVRGFARHLCATGGPRDNSEFDWEDVAQESVGRLLREGSSQYRGSGSERSYAYSVVKCTVIQMARSAKRRRKREETAVALPSPPPPNPSRRIDLAAILGRLDSECRELIERIAFRDEPYSAVASELGLTESSVRSRVHRCLNRARELAAEEGTTP